MQHVIQKFSTHTDYAYLQGGQGTSIKAGTHVMKPLHQHEQPIYVWYSDVFEKHAFHGIQYSKPIRSFNGSFIEDGYGATEYLDGTFVHGRMQEKIKACRVFHTQLKHISKPHYFDSWTNAWTKAQDLGWGRINMPTEFHAVAKDILNQLFFNWKHIDLPAQLIHTDLAGNILFNENDVVIIDFTAGYFPKEYAEVLLVNDSIAWFNEPIESVYLLDMEQHLLRQLLIRAIVFRLSWSLFINPNCIERFLNDYHCFKKVIDFIMQ